MKYAFYRTSERAWQAMFEAVRNAKKSIYIESFILTDDPITHHFFEALKERAREGVKVKIIIDRVGHFWYGSVNKEAFESTGAEVLLFTRWFYHSHRKVLVVDEQIAFLGGVNIRGEYAKWLDLHVRLTGLLAKSALRSFSRVYELSGGRDPEILALRKSAKAFRSRAALYRAKSWFIDHWPIHGKSLLREYYKRKCAEAQQNIIIVTPYFIPHTWLLKSLRGAAERGVKIEVIIPSKTDIWIFNEAHRVFATRYSKFISFYFLPKMNHAKVLLIDDREGLVGSNNIDAQSFDFNLEASVVFQRKDMVGDLKIILEDWKKTATPFSLWQHPAHWYDGIMALLFNLIRPIL